MLLCRLSYNITGELLSRFAVERHAPDGISDGAQWYQQLGHICVIAEAVWHWFTIAVTVEDIIINQKRNLGGATQIYISKASVVISLRNATRYDHVPDDKTVFARNKHIKYTPYENKL